MSTTVCVHRKMLNINLILLCMHVPFTVLFSLIVSLIMLLSVLFYANVFSGEKQPTKLMAIVIIYFNNFPYPIAYTIVALNTPFLPTIANHIVENLVYTDSHKVLQTKMTQSYIGTKHIIMLY